MKKALSCLGLALALVSIPQFVSASEATDKVEVVEDQNATETVETTTEEATEKVAPAAKEATKN